MILYLNFPKEPPFYALASTYKIISLYVKKYPAMFNLIGLYSSVS